MNIMGPISAVLFDWCDTLVSATKIHLQSTTLKPSYPHLTTPANVTGYPASSLNSRQTDGTGPHSEVSNTGAVYNGMRLREDAVELLKFLSAHNIKMGIVSNKNGPQLRKEVHAMGLSEYFFVIIGGGDARENKPSPDPLLTALEVLGISPSKSVLFVGDSDSDTEAALQAGCLPIGYNNFSDKNALSFSSFRDLCIFIEELLVKKYERTTSG